MTKCPNCGNSVPEGARFCGACGQSLEVASVSKDQSLVGTTIAGRFHVLRAIAEGGMGVIYEAEQAMGEGVRRVAIKTLLPELSRDPVVVSRFNRECAVVAELEHPNTVRVYDFGTTDEGTLYIAMEFVRGRPLADVIAEGPMALERCLGITEQIASALEEAHNHGIVHRDLKPENLVLADRAGMRDFVKVLDFGIAKRSSAGARHETKLTQQGMVLGTPPYMSPEQFTGEQLDRTSDIYSLGIIFYEMANGKLPFEGDTPWQWAHLHMNVPPAPFSVPVPSGIEAVVFSALAKDRIKRPQSASEFYRRLLAASQPGTNSVIAQRHSTATSPGHSVLKGDTSPEFEPIRVRTEPSMIRDPDAPNTVDEASGSGMATASTAEDVRAVRSTGTEPGAPRIAASPPLADPRAVALSRVGGTEPSMLGLAPVVAQPTTTRVHRRSRGVGRRVLVALLFGTCAVGATIGIVLWVRDQREQQDAAPPKPLIDSGTAEIVAESSPWGGTATVSTEPPTFPRSTAPRPQTPSGPRPTPPPAASSAPPASTPPPQPVPSATSTPPSTPANPFPFPIPLPSIPGIPQLTIPTPTPNPTTTPPPSTQPQPSVSGAQSCTQAMLLADTDLDAAVSQYQACESAVGRNSGAAGAARAKISTAGTARATSLADQRRCDEANRVVQTLARVNLHRPAQAAISRQGCR